MKRVAILITTVIAVAVAVSLMMQPAIPPASSIVTINSSTINKIGLIHEHLIINTDLMMRYSHYLTPHSPGKQTFMCPECGTAPPPVVEELELYDEPVDEGLGTYDDVFQDAHEINGSSESILRTLIIQERCLRNNLEKLRKKNE